MLLNLKSVKGFEYHSIPYRGSRQFCCGWGEVKEKQLIPREIHEQHDLMVEWLYALHVYVNVD